MDAPHIGTSPEPRRRKSDEARQFSEEQAWLLNTIHDLVDEEVDRRCSSSADNPHSENPPPHRPRKEQPEVQAEMPAESSRPTLWQRIIGFFTSRQLSNGAREDTQAPTT